MTGPAAKKPANLGYVYSAPLSLWTVAFFVIPFLIIVVFSFFGFQTDGKRILYFDWTFHWYEDIFTDGALWLNFLKTFWVALLTSGITLLIAIPCAYYMARSRNGMMLMVLVIVPFLINFLLRLLAWQNVLDTQGFLNDLLIGIGLIPDTDRIQFLNNFGAVLLVLVYISIPYAILPLYASIEKFDFSLLEAARDLGTTHFGSLIRIMIPNVMPGIISAFLFTFIPTFGQFAIPKMVGDIGSELFGNKIYNVYVNSLEIPKVAAMSVVLTLVTAAGLLIYQLVNANLEKRKLRTNVQEDAS